MNTENKRKQNLKSDREAKKGKLTPTEIPDLFSDNEENFIQKPDPYIPLGVFEFPWQKEKGALAPELAGCSLGEVFFSSLVDGISPARLSPIDIAGESFSDGDFDGVDCIWSCALRQPLSAVNCKNLDD